MTGLVTLYLPYLSPSSLYPPRSDRRIVDINDTSLFLALRFVSWTMTTIRGARLRPHKVYMLSLIFFNWATRSLACRWGTCISSCFVGEWEPPIIYNFFCIWRFGEFALERRASCVFASGFSVRSCPLLVRLIVLQRLDVQCLCP